MKRHPAQATSLPAAFFELTKPNVTCIIVVSTALGYYLGGEGIHDFQRFLLTLLGSTLVSSGAGALNHYAEKETDSLMYRTKSRPIPTGFILPATAMNFGIVLIIFGVLLLYFLINGLTAFLALLTVNLYLFVYTPLKRITWLNTSIGAIPGSIPPLGGWTAATGSLAPEAWILFAILFLWQHPHFYAIALMCKNDYKMAKLMMLPVLESDGIRTNRQILWHSMLLIPVSIMPTYIGLLGITYFWGAFILSLGYLIAGFPLIKNYSVSNAKLLLKASVIYLPVLFGLIIFDTII